jgi:hypothetical protein
VIFEILNRGAVEAMGFAKPLPILRLIWPIPGNFQMIGKQTLEPLQAASR